MGNKAAISAGDTIAAIATPMAAGGIGVIRLSGPGAFAVGDAVFKAKSGRSLAQMKAYTAAFGHAFAKGKPVDECIALVFRSPHSYTGEDVAELSCHGGLYILRQVLAAVLAAGARLAQPGEFTRRAFLNGRLDLTRAEAVMDLIAAKGEAAAAAALLQHEGALFSRIQAFRKTLVEIASGLSAAMDFPDEVDSPLESPRERAALRKELASLRESLAAYISGYDAGAVAREGVDTVIAGKPNVGKSTLMNRLTRTQRSIVTAYAGTTRDIVEETVQFGGLLLRLSDTAGLHETQDPVEREGVSRAKARLERAALVLAVFDGSRPLDEEDRELIALVKGRRAIAVVNKADLSQKADRSALQAAFFQVVSFSAATGDGEKELSDAIASFYEKQAPDPEAGLLANERQLGCALRAEEGIGLALGAIDDGMTIDAVWVGVEQAADALAALTGERASEEIIDRVFSKFCVGK